MTALKYCVDWLTPCIRCLQIYSERSPTLDSCVFKYWLVKPVRRKRMEGIPFPGQIFDEELESFIIKVTRGKGTLLQG